MQPIEGFFLITKDGLIFEVKGNVHPENRVIAYLRYVTTEIGDRHTLDGVRYRKIYSLSEREKYLSLNFPHYLWTDIIHGRILQSVHESDVSFILEPVDFLRQLRDSGIHLSPLQKTSLHLANTLVNDFDLTWENLGLTGSLLAGLATSTSDIDLVVYGERTGKKFYESLKTSFDDSLKMKRYTGTALEKHVEFRWHDCPHKDRMKEIEKTKVLQGIFDSYDFFIRIVKTSDEAGFNYGDLLFENHGSQTIKCSITDDSDSIFTPCEYLVNCEQYPNLTKLVSYRGRFTEHVGKGMIVEAQGRLESVQKREDEVCFMQLVMGENPTDYLIPINE